MLPFLKKLFFTIAVLISLTSIALAEREQERLLRISCEQLLAKQIPGAQLQYLGQGGQGVVFKVFPPEGQPPYIAKLFHGAKDSTFQTISMLTPLKTELRLAGLEFVELQPTAVEHLYRYEDPPGGLLNKDSSPEVLEQFKKMAVNVIQVLSNHYKPLAFEMSENTDILLWYIIFHDKDKVGTLSFKTSNFKFDQQSQLFTAIDLL